MDDAAAIVESFFKDAEVAGQLLPDGWYGDRPMENHHRLTFVAQRPKRLLIELDDRILLSFSGPTKVEVATTKHARKSGTATLIISGFRQAVVEYLEYVADAPSRAVLRGWRRVTGCSVMISLCASQQIRL